MDYYGALETGGTKMVCAIGDDQGHIVQQMTIPTTTPAETMPAMIAFFREYRIRTLGIGSFGPVDLNPASPTYGFITDTPKLAWQNFPLVPEFQNALSVPVGLDTDVNAAALGEAAWGCTRDVSNSIYITVGTGIGVGILVEGKPYHGMIHPEGGHILLHLHPDDPMEDSCCPFHRHCLEDLASGPALEKRWGRKGEELSQIPRVWELEAYYLGQAVATYMMLLSPERIVMGGGVMRQPGLLAMVREASLRQVNGYLRSPRLADPDSYLVGACLQGRQGILGALRLAQEAFKTSP